MEYSGLVLDIDNFKFLDKNKFINKIQVLKCLVDKDIPVVLYTDGDPKLVESAMRDLHIKEPAIVMEGLKFIRRFSVNIVLTFICL
ncbi:hypothetical protein AGR56_06115 [Clostridium sp. DMHC 10]|uniref:hypothetical protein n=1 Tax=Clostridium sp. DMHC 10 TaxID=747377 RepID=UPI00069FD743|nr:hypothetical protein [Clostridium sp. DMHC 10]KOF56384.1 hypothetical protein AGR56_06115 [Clostridium sp. DMHC 10]